MDRLIDLLHKGHYSCVVENHSEIRTFSGPGVHDLYTLVCKGFTLGCAEVSPYKVYEVHLTTQACCSSSAADGSF